MMDVFLTLAQAKYDLKNANKECSWLQSLYNSVFDNVYDSKRCALSCEKLCLQVLDALVVRNGNSLPINYGIACVKDLYNSSNNIAVGRAIVDSAQMEPSQGSKPLETPVILIGYLTPKPRTRTSLIQGNGLLYLEDKKNVIICQICKPRREWLNNIVLFERWTFIPSSNFPITIFEGDTRELLAKFGYIEIDQDCTICINNYRRNAICKAPNTLSLEEYAQTKSSSKKFNLKGCLSALSPIHRFLQDNVNGKPFFFAELMSESTKTQFLIVVVFQGEWFPQHWYNFLSIGEIYIFTNLLETTMNKGQPSQRNVFAATNTSDFFKVEQNSVELNNTTCGNVEPSDRKKRKRQDQTEHNNQNEREKRLKEKHTCAGYRTRLASKELSKSKIFWCSPPLAYQGIVTAVVDTETGVYEIDHEIKLYTHFQPCSTFGVGMRTGASVSLHNVHLCKLNQEVVGLCCCTFSTIVITRHSSLPSPFKPLISSISYFCRISQQLSLVELVRFLDLIQSLLKKFKPALSSSSAQPTVLSHVFDLETLMATSWSRDIYAEVFDNPHNCVVSRPSRNLGIPKVQTLQEFLDFVGHIGTQEVDNDNGEMTNEQYGWRYREITQEELAEDTILIGWLSSCPVTGQLFLCDQTTRISCIITETEDVTRDLHKCTTSCLRERKDINQGILGISHLRTLECPLICPSHNGAIVKLASFRVIVETFFGRILHSSNNNVLRKSYLVFSWHQADIIGRTPTIPSFGASTRSNAKHCFVFLVKCKELNSLDLKEDVPTFSSCIKGYFLGKVKNGDGDGDLQLDVYKRYGIIRIFEDCTLLAYLRPGCLYYVTECYNTEQTSTVQSALDVQGRCPVIDWNSDLAFTEADGKLIRHDNYKEWEKLLEDCLEIASVRECILKLNQTDETKQELTYKTKYRESLLQSFRGVIINRDVVISNKVAHTCPFPSIPSGSLYLPHYGLMSHFQIQTLSLGFSFLRNRQLVLTLGDLETPDQVKVYFDDLSTSVLPLGLVPGAMVTFTQVTNHVSRYGNTYFSFTACSDVIIECLPSNVSLSKKAIKDPLAKVVPQTINATNLRDIIDFSNALRNGNVIPTVSHIVCRITAVQKVNLKWTCSKCGKLSNECYCHVTAGNQSWVFSAQARCLVEDGTCEAMLFVEGEDQVKNMLGVSEATWNTIKQPSYGEVWFQRSSYRKTGAVGGDGKADNVLSEYISSPQLLRQIKVVCKQFKMVDNVELDEVFESRTIFVDRQEHSTYILGKIALNVLEISELDHLQQASVLLDSLTRPSTGI